MDYIVRGGKMFVLKEVPAEGKQDPIQAAVKRLKAKAKALEVEYHKRIQNVYIDELNKNNAYISKLISHIQGKFTRLVVPEHYQGKPVAFINRELYLLEFFIYRPRVIIGQREVLLTKGLDRDLLPKNCKDIDVYEVIIDFPYAIPAVFAFPVREPSRVEMLYASDLSILKSYHVYTSGKICTGDLPVSVFKSYTPQARIEFINRINLFSLARDNIERFSNTNIRHLLENMVREVRQQAVWEVRK